MLRIPPVTDYLHGEVLPILEIIVSLTCMRVQKRTKEYTYSHSGLTA